jgi:hypothetical protein
MGRRYQAILRHLGRRVCPLDVEARPAEVERLARHAEGIVLATPTGTHAAYCQLLEALAVPLLCEKPVTMDLPTLEVILRRPGPFAMMAQYAMLDDPAASWETAYNFYQSGSDGLAWDCVTLLGLARGPVTLRAESPVWRCRLNGRALTLDAVGQAYVDFVASWLERPGFQDRAWVREAHRRAALWRPSS